MIAEHAIPDRRLWQAVILQAVIDATSQARDAGECSQRRDARKWFEAAGPDFQDVCEQAGVNPCLIRKQALAEVAEADRRQSAPIRQRRTRSGPGNQKGREPSIYIEHDGQRLTINEWSKRLGISRATLDWRHRRGLPAEQILAPSLGRGGARRAGRGVGRGQTINAGTGALPAAKISAELEISA